MIGLSMARRLARTLHCYSSIIDDYAVGLAGTARYKKQVAIHVECNREAHQSQNSSMNDGHTVLCYAAPIVGLS